MNIEFGPDGCLYIADWYNKIVSHNEVDTAHPDRDKTHGRIWRIRHESQKPRKAPNLIAAETKELTSHLSSPYLLDKRAAWHQLVDRQAVAEIPALQKLVGDSAASKRTRIHALWALEGLGGFDKPLFVQLIADSDDDLSREAIRSLASFGLPVAEVAELVAPRLEAPNAMIRAQVLRTLAEINQADPAVIDLLVRACKPDIAGQSLGGPYERKFERFLARKALEQYVDELKSYLETDLARSQPAGNRQWAIQVLPAGEREARFAEIWTEVASQPIDPETFLSIVGMLDNPGIVKVVASTFSDPAKGEMLLDLAINSANRIDSRRLAQFLPVTLNRLLDSSNEADVIKGLRGVHTLKSRAHYKQVAQMIKPGVPAGVLKEVLRVLSLDPKVASPDVYTTIVADASVDFDIRVEAVGGLIRRDTKLAKPSLNQLAAHADPNQKKLIVESLSAFPAGLLLLYDLWETETIGLDAWSLSASERANKSHRRHPQAQEIFRKVKEREAIAKAQIHERIANYIKATRTLKGNVEAGKLTFNSCLTCHKVGDQGQDIAPALDGSANRDLEHLLTAIVDPDAAVEGAYGLFRVTRKDGSSAEGFLVNRNQSGTTIAMMGGATLNIPRSEIASQNFVGGRSFMPSVFGSLPEQTMVDLIAYIKTLQ